MYRLLSYVALIVTLLVGTQHVSAQELVVGADFTTLFDNREYAGMKIDESGTLFSARLTPKIGVEWQKYNRLMLGVDLVQDFGDNAKFISDANIQLYYAFAKPNTKLFAGIFPFKALRGFESPLFFDRSYRYYHNTMSGVLARYEWTEPTRNGGDSYIEFAMDYTGMRKVDSREAFMILSSARYAPKIENSAVVPYCGYDFMMGHYAKDYDPLTEEGVVDNLLLTPHIGSMFKIATGNTKAPVVIDLRLSYILSLQRDRHLENEWQSPMGGELYIAAEWRGLSLSNRLYAGTGAPFTYYDRYGTELYHGTQHYAANIGGGFYNSTTLAYEQLFFNNTLGVVAGISIEYDGTACGTRQWLQVNVNLDYGFKLRAKDKN